MNKNHFKNRAFTLIELLVVIAIIGLLATLSVLALNNARAKSRDAKRLADVKQIQTAMELYFNSTGHYPTASEFNSGKLEYYSPTVGSTTFMIAIPSAPTPNDGSCSDTDNIYTYAPSADGTDYTLNFCVAKSPISSLPDGNLIAFSGGIKVGSGSGGPAADTSSDCINNPGDCCWKAIGSQEFTPADTGLSGFSIDNGTPYVAYIYYYNSNKAGAMKYNGSTWDMIGAAGFSPGTLGSVSFSARGGTPYVSFYDNDHPGKLTVMKYNGSTWENVGPAGFSIGTTYNSSLDIYGGQPYVAYIDSTNSSKTVVMKYNGSSWETVGAAGFFSSRRKQYIYVYKQQRHTICFIYGAYLPCQRDGNEIQWHGLGICRLS